MTGRITTAKRAASSHPPAAKAAGAAQAAAQAPAGDKEAQGQAAQAGEMAAAKPGGFDKAAFIKAVEAAVAAQAPKNLDEADKFGSSGKAEGVRNAVMGPVAKGREDSARPLADATAKAPDTSKAVEKPVTPLTPTPAGAVPPVDAGAGMPDKAPANQTDLRAGPAANDAAMKEAGVTEQQLATSNEPEFTGALAAKKDAEVHSATAPAGVRAAEAQQLTAAKGDAAGTGAKATGAMAGLRGAALGKLGAAQSATKVKDEQARAGVTKRVTEIFTKAKTEVQAILTGLDTKVGTAFDEGEKAARAAFTAEHTRRMEAYKDARYSGVLGWGRWTRDLFAGMPAEANQIYQEARKIYESRMTTLISSIADLVGRELGRAKDRVAAGKAEITQYVGGLPKDLQSVGRKANADIGDQFQELEGSIDEKSQALAEDLAGRYVEARNAVDEEITKLQEENKGLVDKAKDAVVGVITTVLKLKDMLLGVLSRAANAVTTIIADPIGFLQKFVGAVKAGVMNFGKNILEHLKKGLQSWLFGTLADAGIEIPEKFDLKGIFQLVLSLLGLTWNSIRARIVKQIPEPVMQKIEQTVEIFKILLTQGVTGLWKWVVDKLGDLKEAVMSQIKDFVVTKVITAGITWVISLLNPAAAFIKACKLIYDAVMWFVDNAQRMKEFVDSVLDSVESIAAGGVGKVASMIEGTLAKAIPMVISGLASLLGLGGISDKIKTILEKIQKPVGKLVDGVIKQGLRLAGPLIRAWKRGKAWAKEKYEKGKAWVKGKFQKAKDKLTGKKSDERTPEQKQTAVNSAVKDAEALLDKPNSTRQSVSAGLPAIKAKHRLSVLTTVSEGEGQFHVHAELNPKGDTKNKKDGGKWDLAPGGYPAYEGLEGIRAPLRPGQDEYLENGQPRQGGEVDFHLMDRHVNISPEDTAARVDRRPRPAGAAPVPGGAGQANQASRFLSEKLMTESLDSAIRGNDDRIQKAFSAPGTSAGSHIDIEWNCKKKIGQAFRVAEYGQNTNNPQKRTPPNRAAVEVTEVLQQVRAILRVIDVDKKLFAVQTAFPF